MISVSISVLNIVKHIGVVQHVAISSNARLASGGQ